MRIRQPPEVLGYQMRIPIADVPVLWSQARREQYLLDPRTQAPLSADSRVWPLADNPDLAMRIFEDFSPRPNEAPNGLNLFRLRRNLRDNFESLRHPGETLVAIGTARDIAKVLIARHFIVSALGQPDLNKDCELLGYDVCDETLLSGLMNCGVGAEQSGLRDRYAGLLNAHGLFDDHDVAEKLALEISGMAPEHAPFFPVSVAKNEC